jgi:anaerobic ribonucleoside-triphosphate reductase activating protein
MMQAAGLAAMLVNARASRELNVICFTGSTLERLHTHPPGPGVAELLAQVDLLIDGPYVAALNEGRGLRGSRNQRFHYLTDRLLPWADELEGGKRQAEIHVLGDEALLVGVPPLGVVEGFALAVEQAIEANRTLSATSTASMAVRRYTK